MLHYIRKKIQKRKLKKTFNEFKYEIKEFTLSGNRTVEYAQWLHPFENPKDVSDSKINFYKKISKPGGVIIDIGAHTGDTSVPMALAVGKEGLVIALEPNPYVFKILEKNASLNQEYSRIEAYCFAATEKDGYFTFNYSDASFCNGGFLSRIDANKHRHNYELEVKGKNLLNFLNQNYNQDLDKLDLVKVDAEGYDKEILKSIAPLLDKYKPNLMVECYKRLNQEERFDLFDTMHSQGYEIYRFKNFEDRGERKKLSKQDMLDEKHFEMLALHPENNQILS